MADIYIEDFCHPAEVLSPRNDGMVAESARDLFDRGIAWAEIGAYEQALATWRQALRLTPDLADAYAAIGSVYMTLACWQEAVRSYQKAILAAPYLLDNYYGLGSAYGKMGDFNHAIEAYEQAFKLLPMEGDAHTEAVVADFSELKTETLAPESDTFQDRLRADTEGFDFSALLSSPAARRQAVRQEQAPIVSAIPFDIPTPRENAFAPVSAAETTLDTFATADAAPIHFTDVAVTPSETEIETEDEEEEEAYVGIPPRDRRAIGVLVALLVVLGFMGGRMAITAVNEADRKST
ncbi:MAG: tetratricopeptide repeat protein, partial [Chthonomonadales bacterium]|nr:tetratricopeptide repeat protein [Chthonomonadales bacterium]